MEFTTRELRVAYKHGYDKLHGKLGASTENKEAMALASVAQYVQDVLTMTTDKLVVPTRRERKE